MAGAPASNITELKTTLFKHPLVSGFFRVIASLLLKLTGWSIYGQLPAEKKCVVIGAPHTSNWDFLLFLMYAFTARIDVHWMGKHTLFPRPLRPLMIRLGGIPIDRSKAHSVVEQMVDYFDSVDELTVLIAPEGTRSKVERWKMGFYHIAVQAKLPIYLGFLDSKTKTLGVGPKFIPSGDAEADMVEILAFYKDKQGIKRNDR